jgi:conjugative relaxase-like TrwC/TraI family protein
MMTIRRLTVGSGYRYLQRSIAVGDGPDGIETGREEGRLTRYYTATGTPPGVFLGKGLEGLDGGRGVASGSRVEAEHLERMLRDCADPITGEALGRPPRAFAEQRDAAGKALNRPEAVAGFDLTFSPSKSVSSAWAVADATTREVIYRCHQEAIAVVLDYAEREVFHSRSGVNGVVEEDVAGVVAASFTHFDSRAGDPQLHDHVVVFNRAQSLSDGRWRTLDSRQVFKSAVMLSEMHQGVTSDLLTAALGWEWEPTQNRTKRVDSPSVDVAPVAGIPDNDRTRWEVAGVPATLMAEFSQRSAAIAVEKDALIAAFRADHGREPTSVEVLRLRQTATLRTRRAKVGHTLTDLTTAWSKRAEPFIGMTPEAWVASLSHADVPVFHSADFDDAILTDLAAAALHAVAEKRPTFSRANVLAEIHRQVHGVRFATTDERIALVERTGAIALDQALLLTTPELYHVPTALKRVDGTSRLRPRSDLVYTTELLLEAEDRLLTAGRTLGAPRVDMATVSTIAARKLPGRAFRLSTDQALAVEKIATSGRTLDLLVGPAGTGKSTTMAGLRAAWEADHGPGSVVGLAPSATAAEVLGDEIGIPTENVAKWLYENGPRNAERRAQLDELRAGPGGPSTSATMRRLEDEIARWTFRNGQLVIVDEASLASTYALDSLLSAAGDAGAKVLLVGDWAQLASIDAGGMFRTLASDRGVDAPTLSDVRRFVAEWEKTASLQLRTGSAASIRAYMSHERTSGGERDDMLDTLYAQWRADTSAGLVSLMLAGDVDTVRELNARARRDRVAAGHVDEDGVTIADGQVAGTNDVIVTRENERRLAAGRGWVKNGDVWTVTATHDDGSLTVTRVTRERDGQIGGGAGTVRLPADYVLANVELAYASTAHRAQGRTVDTAHAFVTATTSREVLYVSATRGSEGNHLYVDTHYDPDPDTGHSELTAFQSVEDVLTTVLANEQADVSATDMLKRELAAADSLATLVAEYNTLARMAQAERWAQVLANSGLSARQVADVTAADAYGALVAALRDAEARGVAVADTLPALVAARAIDDAADLAAVLHYRLDRYVAAGGYQATAYSDLVAGLFPRAHDVDDVDLAQALDERDAAIERRAEALASLALEDNALWVHSLGVAPSDPADRDVWLYHVATIAAYRDRWNITDDFATGPEPAATHIEQLGHYRRAVRAVDAALYVSAPVATGAATFEVPDFTAPESTGPELSL